MRFLGWVTLFIYACLLGVVMTSGKPDPFGILLILMFICLTALGMRKKRALHVTKVNPVA